MWNTMDFCIKRVEKEVLGETKGGRYKKKQIWWWNDEVQNVLKLKKCSFKTWQRSAYTGDWKHYEETRTKAKRVARDAKLEAYENFCNELGSKDGEVKISKLAKLRDKKSKDLDGVRCIKDDEDKVFMKDEEIRDLWKRYFCSLLNEMVERM